MLSRDEVITRGYTAADSSERLFSQGNRTSQWIYHAKIKVGNRATRNIEGEYWNLAHLRGILVEIYAREGVVLHIYAIRRVMKYHFRSRREDI